MTDKIIVGSCTVSLLDAPKLRRRLKYSGLSWTETRRGLSLKIHFLAYGSRSAWENERRRGGKHDPRFRKVCEDT